MANPELRPGPMHFDLGFSVVLTGYAAASGCGLAVQLAAVSCTSARLQQAAEAIAANLASPPTRIDWKLVGAEALLGQVASILRQIGVRLSVSTARGDGEAYFYPDSGRLRITKASPAAAMQPALAAEARRLRVLIVDDSATIRRLLTHILSRDPGLEVVAATGLPSEVEALIQRHRPDVLTLDIHMPQMDGITLLRQLLAARPIPAVMISSLAMADGPLVLAALEAGAVDYIQKPTEGALSLLAADIAQRVKTAARAKVKGGIGAKAKATLPVAAANHGKVIAIGSSTGGTEALREVLTRLPAQIPPILIVQHIPALFSAALAKRLNELCLFPVQEAVSGDAVVAGRVLIAPGGRQMQLVREGAALRVLVDDAPPRNLHKPSVDVLFESVARLLGRQAVGAILTGMGADGAAGLLAMATAGAHTIGQDEASCVVYGMPRRAAELGAVREVLDLSLIAEALMRGQAPKSR